MSSASYESSSPTHSTADDFHYRVALVGNPNTGKSTLFNALAGLNVRTGNYPGVTIEKKVGHCHVPTTDGRSLLIDLIDLPGTYSLAPRSPDELVAVEVLTGEVPGEPEVDLIVCVVNATMLRRNLFLVSQILELGKPVVLALNMIDAATSRGLSIDIEQLSLTLGIPVIATSASKRTGILELKREIAASCERAMDGERLQRSQALPASFVTAVDELQAAIATHISDSDDQPSRFLVQRALIDQGGAAESAITKRLGSEFGQRLSRIRQDLKMSVKESGGIDLIDRECEARYDWAARTLNGVTELKSSRGSSWTDRIDAMLTHRWLGLIGFLLIMLAVFQSIYSFASIPMDLIDGATGWASDLISSVMPPGMLRSLIVDGVIAGVGGVLIFLPQIALLFLFLAILEDCGYMARAAFVVDRIMSAFGLSGKSFLPLMSSFACAVPGVMATRVIESPRDRLATIMVAPLMSCSARLPVYLLLIGAFVPATAWLGGWVSLPALVLMAMYCVGIVVAIPVAWILKKTLLRGEASPFVLELPEYKWPSLRVVFARVWQASVAFVVRAGTLIFAASILIWFAGYWPGDHTRQFELQSQLESGIGNADEIETQLQAESAHLIENSALGMTGHAIEPLVKPLGWDWKIGVGAVASFPAREVIIATLGTIYSLGGEEDEEGLIGAMRAAKHPDGSPVYTLPVALSIMVFFALCAQCVSTLLVIRRETNSWFWPILSFTYMTVLAYVGALVTYQTFSRLL
ncbi:Ferrous iron transport protein B [Rubripirellula amarantea]|uniref:Ferrous iron transport protein B n=1 Tax=Rubripirellula amarantea TaxID=2527999 RepID=A0A5C5WUR0_9BACT|nr:ferrous iron transport protein B [Rubripirellula amarantea]TWT54386.1 Ferrous iron transport protein B [Rubripirellula amarantea]